MAGAALDLCDVVRVRKALDVSMATGALQDAVNAGGKSLAVDGDVVARGVGHVLVAMAEQAICLCMQCAGRQKEGKYGERGGQGSVTEGKPGGSACGLSHSAVFFLQGERAIRLCSPGNSAARPMASSADFCAVLVLRMNALQQNSQ